MSNGTGVSFWDNTTQKVILPKTTVINSYKHDNLPLVGEYVRLDGSTYKVGSRLWDTYANSFSVRLYLDKVN